MTKKGEVISYIRMALYCAFGIPVGLIDLIGGLFMVIFNSIRGLAVCAVVKMAYWMLEPLEDEDSVRMLEEAYKDYHARISDSYDLIRDMAIRGLIKK